MAELIVVNDIKSQAVIDTDRALFKRLDTKHPIYEQWASVWRVYKDVLGQDQVEKDKYLPRNKLEPNDQYSFRVEMSEFIPETPLTIHRLIGSLYKEKPKRDLKGQQDLLSELINNSDLEGQHLNAFMERFMFDLVGFGTMRILINTRTPTPTVDPQGRTLEITRAEEIEFGARPYLIPYTPLATIDWEFDEFNELTMVRIKETRFGKADPRDPLSGHARFIKFIHYDRFLTRWWTFVDESREGSSVDSTAAPNKPRLVPELSSERVHGLGIVPMVVVYWPQKLKPMVGNSYVRQMVKADIQKFRTESDMDYDNYLHAHPQLKIWTLDELAEVGVGSGSWMKLNPGGGGMEREDAAYVETPTSAFNALRMQRMDKLDTINRHANTDPMGVVSRRQGTVQASGVARAWSFGTSEARILSDMADTAVVVERAVFDMAVRTVTREDLSTEDDVFEGEVQYPEEFDLSSTQTLLDETEQIGRTVNSPTLLRELHKRIAASKIGDVTPAVVEKIQREIDQNPLINTPVGRDRIDILRMPEIQEDDSTFDGDEEGNNASSSPSGSLVSAGVSGQGGTESRRNTAGRSIRNRSRSRRSPRSNAG